MNTLPAEVIRYAGKRRQRLERLIMIAILHGGETDRAIRRWHWWGMLQCAAFDLIRDSDGDFHRWRHAGQGERDDDANAAG